MHKVIYNFASHLAIHTHSDAGKAAMQLLKHMKKGQSGIKLPTF